MSTNADIRHQLAMQKAIQDAEQRFQATLTRCRLKLMETIQRIEHGEEEVEDEH